MAVIQIQYVHMYVAHLFIHIYIYIYIYTFRYTYVYMDALLPQSVAIAACGGVLLELSHGSASHCMAASRPPEDSDGRAD